MTDSTTKRCPCCQEIKPLTEFGKNKALKSGHTAYCKTCLRVKAQSHYARNHDKVRAYHKEYVKKNPDKIKRYAKEGHARYYERHREEIREQMREKRNANRERYREYWRNWAKQNRIANPEKHKAYVEAYNEQNRERRAVWHRRYRAANIERLRQHWYKSRAKRRGATKGQHVDCNLIWRRDGGICHICGGLVAPDDVHFDHVIPLSKGGSHTYDNIKVAHSTCNMKKGAKL